MSFFITTLTFLGLFLLIQSTDAQSDRYKCLISENPNWSHIKTCFLNVGRNRTQTRFQIEPNHPSVWKIKGFTFESSQVDGLTSDVCETLPYLTNFAATSVSLRRIDADSFRKCSRLEVLDLDTNSLTSLATGIFDWNVYLSTVDLRNNKITKIDEKVFNRNKELKEVRLSMNRLVSFPSNLFEYNPQLKELLLAMNDLRELSYLDEMPVLEHLTTIDLSWNKLTDVDAAKLLEKFPNLRIIDLSDNDFCCARHQEIKDTLQQITRKHGQDTEVNLGNCIKNEKFCTSTKVWHDGAPDETAALESLLNRTKAELATCRRKNRSSTTTGNEDEETLKTILAAILQSTVNTKTMVEQLQAWLDLKRQKQ